MPELPEVEVIKRGLEVCLHAQRIATVQVLCERSFPGFGQDVALLMHGAIVQQVSRRGKLLLISLLPERGRSASVGGAGDKGGSADASSGAGISGRSGDDKVRSGDAAGADTSYTLMVHLRMTGQLVFKPAKNSAASHSAAATESVNSGVAGRATAAAEATAAAGAADSGAASHSAAATESVNSGVAGDSDGFAGGYPSQSLIASLPNKSTRVIISFSSGAKLFFNDQRKFGYLKLTPTSALDQDDFLRRLGPEPLAEDFDWRSLRQALRSSRPVKAALLDQQALAGVGNIYADESLFAARIDPRRPVTSLTVPEYKRLVTALRECLMQSIADGGSTARNYVDALGLRGEFLDLHAKVYGRAGLPCMRCGHALSKIRLVGRGTTLCPNCQK